MGMILDIYVRLRLLGISFFKMFGKAGIPVLIEGLQEGDERIYQAATRALESMGSTAVPALNKALKDDNALLRFRAAKILGTFGKDFLPALTTLLNDPEEWVRKQAVVALIPMGKDAAPAIPALIQALNHERDFAHEEICRVLAAMGSHAIPALIKQLNSDDVQDVYRTAAVLGTMGTSVIPELMKVFQGENENAANGARIALTNIGKDATPLIAELLNHEKSEIRLRTAKALQRMDHNAADAVPSLTQALDDENEDVRFHTAIALGIIGIEEPRAAAVIKKLTKPLGEYEGLELFVIDSDYDRVRITPRYPMVGELGCDVQETFYFAPEEDDRGGGMASITVAGPKNRLINFVGQVVEITGVYAKDVGLIVNTINICND